MTQTVIRMQDQSMHNHWTEADLADLPQDGTRYEIIDGRLYVTPPAGESHNNLGLRLGAMLLVAAPPGWRVSYELGLKIGEQRLVPDLIVLPPGTPAAEHDYNDAAVVKPALVIEIASKSTESMDKGNKMVVYAKGGIPSYWRVTRDLTVHMHQLMENGEYGLLGTVRPDEEYKVSQPFPMTVEPAKLRA